MVCHLLVVQHFVLWLRFANECLCADFAQLNRILTGYLILHPHFMDINKYPSGLEMMSVLRINAAKYCVWRSRAVQYSTLIAVVVHVYSFTSW